MRRRRRRAHARNRVHGYKPLMVTAVMIITLLLAASVVDKKMREVVSEIAANSAKEYSILAVNNCVERILAETDPEYDKLVYIVNEQGSGTAILRTNVTALNTLKARLTAGIQEKLSDYKIQTVKVAIGTLVGSDFFTGRGPKISIRIIPLGNVSTSLRNEFTSAGINQTLHRIMLSVTASVSVVLPGYTTQTVVSTEFCIAETIIVGAVPGTYAQLEIPPGGLLGSD